MIRLVRQGDAFTCGERIWKTNYDNLFLRQKEVIKVGLADL
jgi:hypothetical protein